jgi:hypothetical protein
MAKNTPDFKFLALRGVKKKAEAASIRFRWLGLGTTLGPF